MQTPRLSSARTSALRRTAVVGLSVVAITGLVGCGGSDGNDEGATTSPVETTSTSTSSTTVASTTAPTTSTTAAPTSTVPPTTAAPTTAPPAPAPAPALDPEAAAARIGEEGDWDPDMSTYDPSATLSAVQAVVAGGASAASPEQIFFFNQGRYLGTATSTPRVAISITDTADDEITASYGNYAATDPFCCPSLDPYVVTFGWDGSQVVPEGELPPEGQGLS